MIKRRKSKKIKVGNISIGGNSLISVQSMCNTKTNNPLATIKQIKELEEAGCQIIRVAIPNLETIPSLKKIKKEINIPLVADIHYDYKLAIAAMPFVDKIRIDPGNIGPIENFKKVIISAKDYDLPIRIGVNSGSIEKEILKKYHKPSPIALSESALRYTDYCEKNNFEKIILSLKSSDVLSNIESNEIIAKKTNYPLHIGVTHAGPLESGLIRSGIGIGSLLRQGIGDTIRISLTSNPINEVKAGLEILKSLGLRKEGRTIISCPTCGRTEINLEKLVLTIEKATKNIKEPIKIAVMGCVVNGPGEAKEADIGVAGGYKCGVIFKKGKIIKKVKESQIATELLEEINKMTKN